MIWYGRVQWYLMVWYGNDGMIWYGMVRYDMPWRHLSSTIMECDVIRKPL